MNELKKRLHDSYGDIADRLLAFSHRLHDTPETGFEEFKASAWLAEELRAVPGARVVHGLGELPTAVRADAGSGPLVVTICAEYDALPGVGHACGHNIIAAGRWGPSRCWPGSPTNSTSPCGCWAPRPRRAAAARS